jgi:hypothetical protein
MALQKNMDLNGGIIASNCYVRIHSVEIEKQDGDSNWSLKLLINVYKDETARNNPYSDNVFPQPYKQLYSSIHIPVLKSTEYKFDYDPEAEKGDLIALAYSKLKNHEDFSGASSNV